MGVHRLRARRHTSRVKAHHHLPRRQLQGQGQKAHDQGRGQKSANPCLIVSRDSLERFLPPVCTTLAGGTTGRRSCASGPTLLRLCTTSLRSSKWFARLRDAHMAARRGIKEHNKKHTVFKVRIPRSQMFTAITDDFIYWGDQTPSSFTCHANKYRQVPIRARTCAPQWKLRGHCVAWEFTRRKSRRSWAWLFRRPLCRMTFFSALPI